MQMVDKNLSDIGGAALFSAGTALRPLLNRANMIVINAYWKPEIRNQNFTCKPYTLLRLSKYEYDFHDTHRHTMIGDPIYESEYYKTCNHTP